MLFAHLVIEGIGQLGNLLVGVVRLTSRDKNTKLALVADHNETFRVRDDFLDIETVARVIAEGAFHFSGGLAKDDLALVCAHQDSSIGHPAVRSKVLRYVTVLFLVDGS